MIHRSLSSAAVPRHTVFTLINGASVVQWDESRVQDLLTGRVLVYDSSEYSHAITDSELDQLRLIGYVDQYNHAFVWLLAMPEGDRTPSLKTQERSLDRVRSYYINTMLDAERLTDVEALIDQHELDYRVSVYGDMVAVLSRDDTPFADLKAAENAQRHITVCDAELFKDAVIAFVEVSVDKRDQRPKMQTSELFDFATIVASQNDISLTEGKKAVLVCQSLEICQQVSAVLADLAMETHIATDAATALEYLEDLAPDLLITELELPDMHVWEMLAKAREVEHLRTLITVILAGEDTEPDYPALGLSVAKVDAFLIQPVSAARLRLSIWLAFRQSA